MSDDEVKHHYDCRQTMARLFPYLDRELDQAEQAAVRAHLEACGHCADLFHFERNVLVLVGERLARHQAPPALRARITSLCQRGKQ